ncbi:Hypp3109 [Branchiostoma lanceolatum]|uniref:Hypp3109 protein n=1 Tax=Branchiostoma lanceolatum TaxID=7740 RepID=A0A8J9ZY59_BRALA|nr:Hypp3109 [Branchiostoma lanceolatum]
MSGQVAMDFLSVLLLLACSAANPTTKAVSSKAWLVENSVEYSQIIFNPAKNSFLGLGSNPHVFDVIDVSSGKPTASLRFALPLPGQMLAVEPDGGLVAVAHNSYVSFIVLGATVPYMNTYSVPVVETSGMVVVNRAVCIFPGYGQWTNVVCVSHDGTYERCPYNIYGGALAFLHPNRKWVYSPDTGLSPQSVNKFMVNSTCVGRLWENPNFGDYYYGRHWWFSYDGSRAFLDNGMTLTASDDQKTDMEVHGYFNASTGNNPHIWFSQASNDQYYVAGLKPDTTDITLYTWPYLMPTQTLPFPVPNDPKATNPQPLQVHYADDGRLYTVGKYGQGGDIWGLGYIEFN